MRHSQIIRKSENARFNLFVSLLYILGLERRSSVNESVHDDTETPYIHFVTMSLGLEDFRGNVVGGSAYGPPFLPRESNFGGKPEITHFNVHVLAEEQVSQFEISVDDFSVVEVLQSFKDLEHEIPGFVFGESSFSFNEVI